MAKTRTQIPPKLKQQLVDDAGGKCANPGCASYRTHIHHINEWAIYESHEAKDMVAVCPTCHDAIHHGVLEVTDETVRRWKRTKRTRTERDHIYVEPGESAKLLLGSIAVTGPDGITAFDLGTSNRLSFRLIDGDIMALNLAVTATDGREVLRLVDNHVRHRADDPLQYDRVPGHVRVTAPPTSDFIPGWALKQFRQQEPNYATDGVLPLLDLEVLEPGLVRAEGVWRDDKHVVIITTDRLSFLQPTMARPLSMVGHGAGTVLQHVGPITASLFGFGKGSGTLHIPEPVQQRVGRNDPCWCDSGKKFKKCHGA